MLRHKTAAVLLRMVHGARAFHGWVDVELSKEERAAVADLMAERDALERECVRLNALLDEVRQRQKFRLQEGPWATYERLRKIVVKKEATSA